MQYGLRLLPYAAALLSVGPLIFGGYPHGHDWTFELVRVAEYRAALEAGQLPPYWGENLYGGYGSPIFLFYAPLFLLLATVASILLSIPAASTIVLVALTLLSVVAVERMGRAERIAEAARRVASYVFVLSPYLIGDKLVRNANAEFTALCLVPFVLAALFELRAPTRRACAALAGWLALVILAHNLTALLAAGLVGLGAALLYLPRPSRATWIALGIGTALALGLAAFFWIPALALGAWMRPEQLLSGKFDFHLQFVSLTDLFAYERFYSVGVLPILVWVGGLVVFTRRDRKDLRFRLLVAALVAMPVFAWLATRASQVVWEQTPFLPLFQFPWRMAGPVTLLTALLAGLAFAGLARGRSPRLVLALELAALTLCALNAWPRLASYRALGPQQRTQLDATLRADGVRKLGGSATVGDEYLPSGANALAWKRQPPIRGPVVSASPPARILVERERGSRFALKIDTETGTRLRLARWAFPGWGASLDGEPLALETNALGSLDLAVPPGAHLLELRLAPPPVRRLCLGLSVLALALWASLYLGRPDWLWRAVGTSHPRAIHSDP